MHDGKTFLPYHHIYQILDLHNRKMNLEMLLKMSLRVEIDKRLLISME